MRMCGKGNDEGCYCCGWWKVLGMALLMPVALLGSCILGGIPALLGNCMLFWRPALLGGCMLFCTLACDDVEFSLWGPGEGLLDAPFQPGKRACSFEYNLTSSSGEAGATMMAGPGMMFWFGLVCFSAFWARKARLACRRRM